MMKRTKRGFTLVELIICCAIMTMLAGACTALLMSGEKLYSTGSQSASSQMDINLLQTTLLNRLPSTKVIKSLNNEDADLNTAQTGTGTKDTAVFFDDEGVFVIRYNGKNTTIPEITEFEYTISPIGTSDTARTQFSYTVVCRDGTRYNGGLALSTMSFSSLELGAGVTEVTYQIKDSPSNEAGSTERKAVYFTSEVPAESTEEE